jgi:hypothetical protein
MNMDEPIIVSEHLDKISKEELDFYNRSLVKALGMFLEDGKGVVVKVKDPYFPLLASVLIYVHNKVLKFKVLKSNLEDKSVICVHEDPNSEVNFSNDENIVIEE